MRTVCIASSTFDFKPQILSRLKVKPVLFGCRLGKLICRWKFTLFPVMQLRLSHRTLVSKGLSLHSIGFYWKTFNYFPRITFFTRELVWFLFKTSCSLENLVWNTPRRTLETLSETPDLTFQTKKQFCNLIEGPSKFGSAGKAIF